MQGERKCPVRSQETVVPGSVESGNSAGAPRSDSASDAEVEESVAGEVSEEGAEDTGEADEGPPAPAAAAFDISNRAESTSVNKSISLLAPAPPESSSGL